MKISNLSKLILCIVGCELVGILGTPFTVNAIQNWYKFLDKPFFAPPNWIFGPVWTLLYLLMGISIYLVWQSKKSKVKANAIKLFLIQLFLNFIWSPVFFGLRWPEGGLIIIIALWVYILKTITEFRKISSLAYYLLVPYLLWVSFATLLNASIVVLN